MRRVVCAAMRSQGIVILSPRHWDSTAHEAIRRLGHDAHLWGWEQGFVDQYGIFMDRKEAFTVASNANQIIRSVGGDTSTLYSENLY